MPPKNGAAVWPTEKELSKLPLAEILAWLGKPSAPPAFAKMAGAAANKRYAVETAVRLEEAARAERAEAARTVNLVKPKAEGTPLPCPECNAGTLSPAASKRKGPADLSCSNKDCPWAAGGVSKSEAELRAKQRDEGPIRRKGDKRKATEKANASASKKAKRSESESSDPSDSESDGGAGELPRNDVAAKAFANLKTNLLFSKFDMAGKVDFEKSAIKQAEKLVGQPGVLESADTQITGALSQSLARDGMELTLRAVGDGLYAGLQSLVDTRHIVDLGCLASPVSGLGVVMAEKMDGILAESMPPLIKLVAAGLATDKTVNDLLGLAVARREVVAIGGLGSSFLTATVLMDAQRWGIHRIVAGGGRFFVVDTTAAICKEERAAATISLEVACAGAASRMANAVTVGSYGAEARAR